MPEVEIGSPIGTPTAASMPATPDTPGGPLFSAVRIDSLEHGSFAFGRCSNCLPTKGQACFADFSAGIAVRIPSISLSQKLAKELEKAGVFEGWSEGKLNFPPTYKYETNSDKYFGEDPKAGKAYSIMARIN